ncbi:tetratricopeptide repeat protein [bacterium]|nr:tetratricopeptide repeat protein [bacterium]
MSNASLDAQLQQARAMTRQRDYESAIAIYRDTLDSYPDAVAAHEGLAMVAFVSNDYPLAISEFQRLSQLEPTEARHYVNLGAVFNRTGEHVKAADALRKAIQRDRRCADAYYNLGIAQRKMNQLSMAVSAYKEAIRIDPQMAEAYQNLGNVYSEMSNFQLAILNFKKALEIQPDFEKARVGLLRAEEAVKKTRASANPFGRLVAGDASSVLRAPLIDARELTPAERVVDRQQVRRLADELHSLASECNEFLKTRLEPSILELQRTVAEGDFRGLAFHKASARFREDLDTWEQLRQSMKRKMLELRGHEELIAIPGAVLS